jgi:hypothetical protein
MSFWQFCFTHCMLIIVDTQALYISIVQYLDLGISRICSVGSTLLVQPDHSEEHYMCDAWWTVRVFVWFAWHAYIIQSSGPQMLRVFGRSVRATASTSAHERSGADQSCCTDVHRTPTMNSSLPSQSSFILTQRSVNYNNLKFRIIFLLHY